MVPLVVSWVGCVGGDVVPLGTQASGGDVVPLGTQASRVMWFR